MTFTQAIVRPPGKNFIDGITSMLFGKPDFGNATKQHLAYRNAIERCGVSVTQLEPDLDFPDSTFVEDTAVLTKHVAVISRPGAPSRMGEVASMREVLRGFYDQVESIESPGTLDGGDICQVDQCFFIGVSERTNEEGARQLSAILKKDGFDTEYIDIRTIPGLLHLKSGMSYLGENQLVLTEMLLNHPAFVNYQKISVLPQESYAANCVRMNEYVLFASGYPVLAEMVEKLGLPLIQLEVSEFQKMDGGLSCLSLRF